MLSDATGRWLPPGPEARGPSGGAGAGSEHRLYAHIAWMTLAGRPLIGDHRRASAESHLMALCRTLNVQPLEVCVLADRVHLLVRFSAGQSVADLARRVLDGSEARLNAAGHQVRWSRRYAAETVSPREVRRVMRRIARLGEAGRWRARHRPVRSAPSAASAATPVDGHRRLE